MTSIFRIMNPHFDPPATARNAGVRPSPTPNVNVRRLDKGLVQIFEQQVEKASSRK